MRLLTSFFLGLFSLAVVSVSEGSAIAQSDRAVDDPRGAMEFVGKLSADTITAWTDETLSSGERDAIFRDIFEQATDVQLLARAMLGRHFRTATRDQRRAYMRVMREYIVTEFDNRMTQIGFKELEVIGTTPAPGRQGHLFVQTKVDRDEGGPLLADWRLRKKNGKFQVINLEIEGINLVITNREYFASRINALGGLEGLIKELEQDYIVAKETAPGS